MATNPRRVDNISDRARMLQAQAQRLQEFNKKQELARKLKAILEESAPVTSPVPTNSATVTSPAPKSAMITNPTSCLMCYKNIVPGSQISDSNDNDFCSHECSNYHTKHCMFCSSNLPTNSVNREKKNFCDLNCYYSHIESKLYFRKCTCGAYLTKDKIKIYVNGRIHCSEKCQTAWNNYVAKPTQTSGHYVGMPFFMNTNALVVGVRIRDSLFI